MYRSASVVQTGDERAQRAALTDIYFLLTEGEVSRWHRVRSDEVWHFLEGDALELHQAETGFVTVATSRLGLPGESTEPVHVIPANAWQAARTLGKYTLVSCTVGPGFEYADFELLKNVPVEAAALRFTQPQLAHFI